MFFQREEEIAYSSKNHRKGQKRAVLLPINKDKDKNATDLETVKRNALAIMTKIAEFVLDAMLAAST